MSTEKSAENRNSTGPQILQTDTSSGTQELAAAVDDLLDQLQHKFDSVSNEILGKLDDMAHRLDELEASLTTSDGTTTTAPPTKS
ncbi:hypothetical protein VTN31DRAFT_4484 [Thermomyces dupontii]|uniref:uncharacterized protein n=1 Tax=Talaromyces thermophilus TaxID=28565 RepID=UPI003743674C